MMNDAPLRLGLVGIGKIACDQHVPALTTNPHFAVIATASRAGALPDLPAHVDIGAMIAGGHALDAVSLCTPPQGRYAQARAAIDAGLHVMLEKPPGATVSEVVDLVERARRAGVTLFVTWHSREASSVDAARTWLAERRIDAVRIDWREDIRVWHPAQEWILDAGGFGVFDPGINALSIATAILPAPLRVDASELFIPANRAAPIAASLRMVHDETAPVIAEFDFLQTGPQSWNITVETDTGTLRLTDGGSWLSIDGAPATAGANEEYARLYRRFAALIAAGDSDVDLRPLMLVADALMLGRATRTAAFDY